MHRNKPGLRQPKIAALSPLLLLAVILAATPPVASDAGGKQIAGTPGPAQRQVLIRVELVDATPSQADAASRVASGSVPSVGRYRAALARAGARFLAFPAWATAEGTTWGMQVSHGTSLGLTPPLGTSLQVTPHVNPDGTLRLYISAQRVEASPAAPGGFRSTSVNTWRTVASGGTAVLAGMGEPDPARGTASSGGTPTGTGQTILLTATLVPSASRQTSRAAAVTASRHE